MSLQKCLHFVSILIFDKSVFSGDKTLLSENSQLTQNKIPLRESTSLNKKGAWSLCKRGRFNIPTLHKLLSNARTPPGLRKTHYTTTVYYVQCQTTAVSKSCSLLLFYLLIGSQQPDGFSLSCAWQLGPVCCELPSCIVGWLRNTLVSLVFLI